MIIEKISIGKFGKLENFSCTLSDGFNLIEGENESGKSTLLAFVSFIFYGLDEESGDKERYAFGGKAFGYLELRGRHGRFRIERLVGMGGKGAPEEEVTVTDIAKNAPVKGNDPAAMFLGVSKEMFVNSCFLAQSGRSEIERKQLAMAVENMLSSADESVSAGKSAEKLREEISVLKGNGENKGLIENKKNELENLKNRAENAAKKEEEYRRIEGSLCENLKKIESNKKDLEDCSKLVAHADALHALERMKRAGKASEKLESVRNEKQALLEKESYNGFFPDRTYVKNLSSEAISALEICKGIEDHRDSLAEYKEKLKDLPEPVKGQEGKLLRAIQQCQDAAAKNKMRMLICGGGAGIFAVLVVLFAVLKITVGAILCGIAALIAFGACILFYTRQRAALYEENDLYESVGARSKEELSEAVERHAALIAERESLCKGIDEEEKKLARENELLIALFEKAEEDAARWGKHCDSAMELSSLSEKAEQVYEALEELNEEEKKAKAEFSALELPLGEDELRRLVTLVRTDGVKKEITPEEYKSLSMKCKFYAQTCEGLSKRTDLQKEQLAALEKEVEDSGELQYKISLCEEELSSLSHRLEVLEKAEEAITETISYMKEQILPGVLLEASAFLSSSTSGKYTSLCSSPDFSVCATNEQGENYPLSSLSCGTAELCGIALRLGMTGKLFKNEKMPVFFDESFAHFDDLRKAAAFIALSERVNDKKNQIFLVTCHKRDSALLEKITKVNRIQL